MKSLLCVRLHPHTVCRGLEMANSQPVGGPNRMASRYTVEEGEVGFGDISDDDWDRLSRLLSIKLGKCKLLIFFTSTLQSLSIRLASRMCCSRLIRGTMPRHAIPCYAIPCQSGTHANTNPIHKMVHMYSWRPSCATGKMSKHEAFWHAVFDSM